MANVIIPKRTSTKNAVPLSANLVEGEIASNTNDGRLFIKRVDGNIEIFYNQRDIKKVAKKYAIVLG